MAQPAKDSSEKNGESGGMITDIRQALDEALGAHREELQRLVDEIRLELKGVPRSKASTTFQECCTVEECCSVQEFSNEQILDVDDIEASQIAEKLEEQKSQGEAESQLSPQDRGSKSSLKQSEPRDTTSETRPPPRHLASQHTFISRRAAGEANHVGSPLQRFVQSVMFENISGGVICINAIAIGIHANQRAVNPGMCEEVWPEIFLLFTCTFFIDLVLRIVVEKNNFFCGADFRWNVLDMIIVIAGFVEEIMTRAGNSSCPLNGEFDPSSTTESQDRSNSVTILRILRIMKVLRVLKAFRVMTVFHDLRMMVHSTLNCLMPLVWACVLLGFVNWCFGVYFIHLAADHISEAIAAEGPSALEAEDIKQVRKWFGSLPSSMFTLFLSITSGTSWEVPCAALFKVSGDYTSFLFYVAFIALTVFAVLNVITGVFVENATTSAKNDRETAIRTTLNNREKFQKDLFEVFQEADADASGQLTLLEFEEHLEDARVQAFLERLGLDFASAQRMFQLLDYDHSGMISLDEFITGCMNLKGDAKTIDIEWLKMDIQAGFRKLSRSIQRLEHRTASCRNTIQTIELFQETI